MQEPEHRQYTPVSDEQQFPLIQHAAPDSQDTKTLGRARAIQCIRTISELTHTSISTQLDSCFRNHRIGLGSPYSLLNHQRKQETSQMAVPNSSAQNVPCLFSNFLILLVLQFGGRENREVKCTTAFSHVSCSKSHHTDTMRKKVLWCTSLLSLPYLLSCRNLRRKKTKKTKQKPNQKPHKKKKPNKP